MVEEVDVEGTSSQAEAEEEAGEVGEVPDLESELREFLESEPALSNSPLQDDRTIEEILSES
jgi:bromodomain-containing protein 7/9